MVARRSHAAAVAAWPLSLLSDRQNPARIVGKPKGAGSPAASRGCLLHGSHLIWSLPAYSSLGRGREGAGEGSTRAGAWGQSVPGVQLGTGVEKAFPLVVCVQGTLGIEPSWKTRDWGGSWRAAACPTPGIVRTGGSRAGPGQFLNPSRGLGVEGKVSRAWLEADKAQLCRISRYRGLTLLRDLLETAWKVPGADSHWGSPKKSLFAVLSPAEALDPYV